MNPFSLKNLKSYGLPLLISFLGFFIGYTQKTNLKLEGIYDKQTEITYQIENYADILHRIENKVDGLAVKVETNTSDIAKCNRDITNLKYRVTYLEGKER